MTFIMDDLWTIENKPCENPLKEMIKHLGSGELWGMYEGVQIPSLACNIEPLNFEKRARSIVELLADPGVSERYIRNMARDLQIRCINEGKSHLSDGIGKALSLSARAGERKLNLDARETLKERMREIL